MKAMGKRWSVAAGIHEKLFLSEPMERAYFESRLNKREVAALRLRCETYQGGNPPTWTNDILPAYSRYFGFLSALKVKACLLELKEYGYLEVFSERKLKVIDFGAGTLGASLGAREVLGSQMNELLAIDSNLKPVEWAMKTYRSFLPPRIKVSEAFPDQESLENTILISVDVLNEMGLMEIREKINTESQYFQMIQKWIALAHENTILLFIEPSNKKINRNFLHLRNELVQKIPLLLPCTHSLSCPALKTDDWCHEDRLYKAPSSYWNLVHELGFERNRLQYSFMALSKQKSRFQDEHFRMVSRNLKSKGKYEKWFCGQGKRWKESLLTRFQNEANERLYESKRGDILDSSSTDIRPPA